jgi:5-oxopent-3-ene-1,2,5-tricarboxylate decarboxylase / 2-hydroxyhepta-2,4-diene-1,7-dioate isomerase
VPVNPWLQVDLFQLLGRLTAAVDQPSVVKGCPSLLVSNTIPYMNLAPSKIVAVHLSYRSRAAERGRVPAQPSYFLKAPSTLSVHGAPVARPKGCQLLAFEGEIALVIGSPTRDVTPEQAWASVGWVTAANDFGLYDLKYADPGSNVHSKGMDGFTPAGPETLPAGEIDPGMLRLRTWVNGELAQDAASDDLLWSLGFVVADLSRVMTLLPGDLILTGTPTGSSVVVPGDVVEVEVTAGGLSTGRLRSPITDSGRELGSWGAPPVITDATMRDAYGAHRSIPK